MSVDNTPPEEKNESELTGAAISGLFRPLLFGPGSVRQLFTSDFFLDNKELICIRFDDCAICLFYSENRESSKLCEIWATASAQVPGIHFAACHLGLERRVTENFKLLNADPNHPFFWARLQAVPFILIYRRGWAKAIYNGERATQPLIDYALLMACKSDYEERETSFYSITADTNVEMTGPKERVPPPNRSKSTEFKVANPLRGYDPVYPVRKVTPDEINIADLQRPSLRVPKPIVIDPQIIANNASIAEPIKDVTTTVSS